MSENADSRNATRKKSNGKEGSFRRSMTWSHLSDDKREQYERIEERVREKMERGEL